MKRRLLICLIAGLIPLLASCSSDRATQPQFTPQYIVNGSVDTNNTYSNVGAFIVQSPTTGNIFPICSGTLISPTVFLTAAHCTAYFLAELAPAGFKAFVSFNSPIGFGAQTNLQSTTLLAVSQAIGNPAYNQTGKDPQDLAVLILANAVRNVTPAALPAAGLLDQVFAKGAMNDAKFTAVGYGVQDRVVGGGQPFFTDVNPLPRMFAFSSFNSLGPGYLRLSQNASKDDGGTCFGDSGGPNFLSVNGKNVLVAVTITGDAVCRSTNVDERLDTPNARAFLSQYVTLP